MRKLLLCVLLLPVQACLADVVLFNYTPHDVLQSGIYRWSKGRKKYMLKLQGSGKSRKINKGRSSKVKSAKKTDFVVISSSKKTFGMRLAGKQIDQIFPYREKAEELGRAAYIVEEAGKIKTIVPTNKQFDEYFFVYNQTKKPQHVVVYIYKRNSKEETLVIAAVGQKEEILPGSFVWLKRPPEIGSGHSAALVVASSQNDLKDKPSLKEFDAFSRHSLNLKTHKKIIISDKAGKISVTKSTKM